MAPLPEPVPGLVIGYAYLWRDEAARGQTEGRKDRPCVIVLSVRTVAGETVVTVAPITHTPPKRPELGIEIPAETKRRLRLDEQPSWVIATELNQFIWPGVDLRPNAQGEFSYGLLPAGLYRIVRDRILDFARAGRARMTPREG